MPLAVDQSGLVLKQTHVEIKNLYNNTEAVVTNFRPRLDTYSCSYGGYRIGCFNNPNRVCEKGIPIVRRNVALNLSLLLITLLFTVKQRKIQGEFLTLPTLKEKQRNILGV